MIRMIKAGTAVQLLCLPVALSWLTACGRHDTQASAPKRDAEVVQTVEATKQNPSMTDPSKAGAPLHFDPYPKADGKKHHGMESHQAMQNMESH
jgi:hypothetical protein